MKTDIVLAGVGGQGILSIAASIGMAALHGGFYMKQSEVHGMSQRGGAVQSHMRLSSDPISSDLIPKGKADIIISVEPMEALRYLPYLSSTGWIVSNNQPFVNIPDYPELDDICSELKKHKNHVFLNADDLAEKAGSKRASNIVMLGAASPFLNMPIEYFEKGIADIFGRKGEKIVNLNLQAFRYGREISEEKIK